VGDEWEMILRDQCHGGREIGVEGDDGLLSLPFIPIPSLVRVVAALTFRRSLRAAN
jgi:hypothetical protein